MAAGLEQGYWQRVRGELGLRPLSLVLLLAAVVSTQILFQPHLFEMWDAGDIALAWFDYLGEVSIIGAAMWLAVVLVEQSHRPHGAVARIVVLACVVFALVTLLVWLINWRYSGHWQPGSLTRLLGVVLKCSILGGFAYAARAAYRYAERAHAHALALETARRDLQREAAEAQLRLLQAQIEPHFLFNTLANVRRLYRMQPAAGAHAIDNLMTYLHAALPKMRRTDSTLADEFDLIRAYLELFQVRMGARLRYALELPAALREVPFAPMVLVTLVENAIKHGLAPCGGGTVRVSARRSGERLELSVTDDGVGFGSDAGGHGVGLANIWRQLALRHGDAASLSLEQRQEGGVVAQIALPLGRLPMPLAPRPEAA